MYPIRRITTLPNNFDEFAAEIAEGWSALYGVMAGIRYRSVARRAVQTIIDNPSAAVFAAADQRDVAALLFAVSRDTIGQITLIHVLARYTGQGIEQQLLANAVQTFRRAGVDAVLSEVIPFCPLDVHDTYRSLGFTCIERAILAAPLDAPGLARAAEGPISAPLHRDRFPDAAQVIADAYRGHPGRKLHIEVGSPEGAHDFLEAVVRGEYGETPEAYLRTIDCDGQLAGVIVGCQVAPGHGFVLQIAVRRAFQGQGLGTQLLRDLADAFRQADLERVALGVTRTNPALRLYTRLGFEQVRPVNAYVWWR